MTKIKHDLIGASLDICIESYFSHANTFCQSHSHSIHIARKNSLCLPRLCGQRWRTRGSLPALDLLYLWPSAVYQKCRILIPQLVNKRTMALDLILMSTSPILWLSSLVKKVWLRYISGFWFLEAWDLNMNMYFNFKSKLSKVLDASSDLLENSNGEVETTIKDVNCC